MFLKFQYLVNQRYPFFLLMGFEFEFQSESVEFLARLMALVLWLLTLYLFLAMFIVLHLLLIFQAPLFLLLKKEDCFKDFLRIL
jgi:hypothetical protein